MRLVQKIIYFFKFCGFHLISLNHNDNKKIDKYFFCLTIIYLFYLFCVCLVTFYYAEKFFFLSDAASLFTDIIQLFAPILSHVIMLFESIVFRKNHKIIWNNFCLVDRYLQSYNNDNIVKIIDKSYINYIIKLILTMLVCTFVEIKIMTAIIANKEWSRHWFASIFTFIMTRAFHLFYTFYVDIITVRLQILNNELLIIGENSLIIGNHLQNNKEKLYTQLKSLKNIYTILWENCVMLNDCFGWSQLANITANFICLTVDFYWIYASLYYQTNVFGTGMFVGLINDTLNQIKKCWCTF